MTEKALQKKIIEYYKSQGRIVIKIMMANIVGVPDLLILGGPEKVMMIEVKAPNGRLSPGQAIMIARIRAVGVRVDILKDLGCLS